MKKVIFGALLLASIGTLSAFTSKTDTANTVATKTQLGTADTKTQLGTADTKTQLGTADAMKSKVAHDKIQLGTAD
jgi:predicted ribosomally synthesized peptide with SipW-like signal peptide